jgi:hypothetical protein
MVAAAGLLAPGLPVVWVCGDAAEATLVREAAAASALPHVLVLVSSSAAVLLALLRSPRVRAALSSCGLAVAQEALLQGKALACLPLSVEQRDVAARLSSLGLATACTAAGTSRAACIAGAVGVSE